MTEPELLELPDAAAWGSWLELHQAEAPEAWLRIAKRGSGLELISIGDALDVALCWGWIDGQRKGLDDRSFRQRYCPRRPTSTWSAINVAKVEALTAAGRMRPAGLREVEAAQADGRWAAAYASQRTAEVPTDLADALAAVPAAALAFERLSRSDRYLLILTLAKTPTPAGRARALTRIIGRLGG